MEKFSTIDKLRFFKTTNCQFLTSRCNIRKNRPYVYAWYLKTVFGKKLWNSYHVFFYIQKSNHIFIVKFFNFDNCFWIGCCGGRWRHEQHSFGIGRTRRIGRNQKLNDVCRVCRSGFQAGSQPHGHRRDRVIALKDIYRKMYRLFNNKNRVTFNEKRS